MYLHCDVMRNCIYPWPTSMFLLHTQSNIHIFYLLSHFPFSKYSKSWFIQDRSSAANRWSSEMSQASVNWQLVELSGQSRYNVHPQLIKFSCLCYYFCIFFYAFHFSPLSYLRIWNSPLSLFHGKLSFWCPLSCCLLSHPYILLKLALKPKTIHTVKTLKFQL